MRFGWIAMLEYAAAGFEIGHGEFLAAAALLFAGGIFTWLQWQQPRPRGMK